MKRLILLLIIILSPVFGAAAQNFKNEVWLEDFAQLKRERSAHYANLEWAVAERGVNLKQLAEQTDFLRLCLNLFPTFFRTIG